VRGRGARPPKGRGAPPPASGEHPHPPAGQMLSHQRAGTPGDRIRLGRRRARYGLTVQTAGRPAMCSSGCGQAGQTRPSFALAATTSPSRPATVGAAPNRHTGQPPGWSGPQPLFAPAPAAPSRRRYLLPGGASANNGDGLRASATTRRAVPPPGLLAVPSTVVGLPVPPVAAGQGPPSPPSTAAAVGSAVGVATTPPAPPPS
jgi:hypothetical protein